MSYDIKSRLNISNEDSIPVLKPDHVSLGKCVTCHQLVRKYATIKDLAVVNLLRDGGKFHGFKKMMIESSEEEGFANMHHVILLSSPDDVRKEVCVRRGNNLEVDVAKIKEENDAVTDTNSLVLITYNSEKYLDLFHLANKKIKHYKMMIPSENFKVYLTYQVLYIIFRDQMLMLNFTFEKVVTRTYDMSSENKIISLSSKMLATWQRLNGMPTLCCDFLEEEQSVRPIIVSPDTLFDLMGSKTLIIPGNANILWLSAGSSKCSIYVFTKSKELVFCKAICLDSFYPEANKFLFERSCYCASTQQVFLLYIKDDGKNASSFIIIIDLLTLKVTSILEMELTLNRKPHLLMYPSRDGSKLFVQETFENRVIFFQVFSLIPSGFTLTNITKQYIWKTFSEEEIQHANIPQNLIKQLLLGY